jgi:hypothetical protein
VKKENENYSNQIVSTTPATKSSDLSNYEGTRQKSDKIVDGYIDGYMTYPKKPFFLLVFEIMHSLSLSASTVFASKNILVCKHYTIMNFSKEYLLGMIIK